MGANHESNEITYPRTSPGQRIGIGFIISTGAVMDAAAVSELVNSSPANVPAAIGILVLGTAVIIDGFAELRGVGILNRMSKED